MPNAINWDSTAATSANNLLSTELTALANDARTSAGTEYDNAANLNQYGWLALQATFAVAPSDAAPHCKVYLVRKFDGTNYEDGSASVVPSNDALVASINVQASTAAQKIVNGPILLPPFAVKALVENQTGTSFENSTSHTLDLHVANDEVQ